jgi:riboflavin kinase / FMN adenylyltransferase
MRIHYQFDSIVPLGPTIVALSGFDGVHRLHRKLIARAAELAMQQGAITLAAVAWPRLNSGGDEQDPPRLTTLAERLDRLGGLSLVDTALILASPLASAQCLDQVSAWSDVRTLLVALGDNELGSSSELIVAARERGISVEVVTAEDESMQVTADAVIRLIEAGAVEAATASLGHPFTLYGEVTTGDRRGRLLGFPTANLRPAAYGVVPANGVYAVRVRLPGEAVASHPGVVNVGVRPTFGGDPLRLIEVHLLDATLDLYGVSIGVEFVRRLRAEQRFDGLDALKAQIAADAQQAREILAADPWQQAVNAASLDAGKRTLG